LNELPESIATLSSVYSKKRVHSLPRLWIVAYDEPRSETLQVDEIWSYVGKKQARVTKEDSDNVGDQYVFVALDPDTKLVPSFSFGKRSLSMATSFMYDLKSRIRTRFQLSTDSLAAYRDAVDYVFGDDIDYAMVHNNYRSVEGNRNEVRYSAGCIVGITIKWMAGNPDKNIFRLPLLNGRI